MASQRWQRWQDWVLLLVGIWLVVAPWALGTSADSDSSKNAWTIGALVILTAAWALAKPADETPGWLQALFGTWLFATPWLFGFSGLTEASWNAWLAGASIVVLACWELIELAAAREAPSRPIHGDAPHHSH